MKEMYQRNGFAHETTGHTPITIDWLSLGKEAACCIGPIYKKQAADDKRFHRNTKDAQLMSDILYQLGHPAYIFHKNFPTETTFLVPNNQLTQESHHLIVELDSATVIHQILSVMNEYAQTLSYSQKTEKITMANYGRGLEMLAAYIKNPWIRMELTSGANDIYTVTKMDTEWVLGTPADQFIR